MDALDNVTPQVRLWVGEGNWLLVRTHAVLEWCIWHRHSTLHAVPPPLSLRPGRPPSPPLRRIRRPARPWVGHQPPPRLPVRRPPPTVTMDHRTIRRPEPSWSPGCCLCFLNRQLYHRLASVPWRAPVQYFRDATNRPPSSPPSQKRNQNMTTKNKANENKQNQKRLHQVQTTAKGCNTGRSRPKTTRTPSSHENASVASPLTLTAVVLAAP